MAIQELLGHTITHIAGAHKGASEIVFTLSDGRRFYLHHEQDCCERVEVEDICGDIADLVGFPIVRAEESSNTDNPPPSTYIDSWTWTFYILGTARGTVTLRWLGESNGYYSERVDADWLSI